MTVGPAFSRGLLIKIDQWWFRLRTSVRDDGRQLKHLIICFTALLVHTFSHFIWCSI